MPIIRPNGVLIPVIWNATTINDQTDALLES